MLQNTALKKLIHLLSPSEKPLSDCDTVGKAVFLKEEGRFCYFFETPVQGLGLVFLTLKINALCWVDITQKKNLQHRSQNTLISSCNFRIKLQIPFIISKLAVTHSTQISCIICINKWQVSILPVMSIS